MIDASKPDTFPPELENIVLKNIAELQEGDLQKIKGTHIEYASDVMCAIEQYLRSSAAYQMYHEELIPVFDRYELLCFHATRVENVDTIVQNGIVSDIDKYEQFLTAFLRHENVPEIQIQSAMGNIRGEYEQKYGSQPHQICFFINYDSLYDKSGCAAYDQFCETVGGELARCALEKTAPDILSVLQEKGVPVVVKFKTKFSKVDAYHKDALIYPFVCAVAAKHLWGYDYVVEADSSLIGDVFESDILEVIKI